MVKLPRKPTVLQAEFDASIRPRRFANRPEIEWVPIRSIRPFPNNSRVHSEKQIAQLAQSLLNFGFIKPIAVDEQGQIVAGEAIHRAAAKCGLLEVPVVKVTHLSPAQIRAYRLADNKLAEKAGWDLQRLAIELPDLELVLPEFGLDLSATGFEPAEIDAILLDYGDGMRALDDPIPDVADTPAIAQVGDLFLLGDHRLFVGDARDRNSFTRLMRSTRAAMAVLDIPYNVPIGGHVGGRGAIKHAEFICASGELSPEQFTEFLTQGLGHCAQFSIDGAIHYVFVDWRHTEELQAAGRRVYTELKNLCVWIKSNAGQGSFYRSQHELVFVFKNGTAPHLNTFELGQRGRMRSNCWHYAGGNSFRAGRMDELRMHPTVKPLAMIVDMIRDCSKRGDVVLDAFAGSGTTIIAAEQTGRRAYCMEIDPRFADVCIRRWQAFTRHDAILDSTGQTFDAVAAKRRVRIHRDQAGP